MPSPNLTPPAVIPLTLVDDGARVMRICNACRYCEGFCAVFPAMERRLTFSAADLQYLANLCHDCQECYHACQYAPPHPFGVDLPRTLAALRRVSYRRYAWPGIFAGLFDRGVLTLALSAALAPVLLWATLALLVEPAVLFGAHSDADGAFYRVMPHTVMVGLFGVLGVAAAAALVIGPLRFWRDIGESPASFLAPAAIRRALTDAFTLRYLDGAGDGCAYPADLPSGARRWFHHMTFYGFLLAFAATSVAATYHNVFGWPAPYPRLSLPVVLGCLGGAGLIVGPLGLLWLKARRPASADRAQTGMDVAFLVLLFLTSASGFLLLVAREGTAMGMLLAVHLGIVAGLFLTMPYGKFVHATYRFCALLKNALEDGR